MATIGRVRSIAKLEWPFKAMERFPRVSMIAVHIFFLIGSAIASSFSSSGLDLLQLKLRVTPDHRQPGSARVGPAERPVPHPPRLQWTQLRLRGQTSAT